MSGSGHLTSNTAYKFEDLSKSIEEAGKIRRGEVKASRMFTHNDADVCKLRKSAAQKSSILKRLWTILNMPICIRF